MNRLEAASRTAVDLFTMPVRQDGPPNAFVAKHIYELIAARTGVKAGHGIRAAVHYYLDEQLEVTVGHSPSLGRDSGRQLIGRVCLVNREPKRTRLIEYRLAMSDSLTVPDYFVKDRQSVYHKHLLSSLRDIRGSERYNPVSHTQNVYKAEAAYLENLLVYEPGYVTRT